MISYPTRYREPGASVGQRMGKQRLVAEVPRRLSGGSHHTNSKLAGTADVMRFLSKQIKPDVPGQRSKLHLLKAIY